MSVKPDHMATARYLARIDYNWCVSVGKNRDDAREQVIRRVKEYFVDLRYAPDELEAALAQIDGYLELIW